MSSPRRFRRSRISAALALPTVLVAALGLSTACHNTGQGIKQDTKRALEKTGEKLQKAGKKIKGGDEK